jgi:DHA3 family macrolide efflux protein-like MFS transporter
VLRTFVFYDIMKNRNAILLLFLANTVSGISQGICMIAIPWYFTATLGWQSSFGIFYGILTLISTVWSIYAGTLIDKYNRKNIQIVYSFLGFLLMSLAALAGYFENIPLWLVSGVAFAFTILLYNIHYMNIYSIAQEISPPEYYNKIISYLEVQGQATTILGGAAAAILMEGSRNGILSIFGFHMESFFTFVPWSLYQIYALDAFTYFLAILILISIRIQPRKNRIIESESAWIRIKTGWNFLRDKPALIIVGWLSPAVFVCVLLISFFLMPSYVSQVLGASSNVFASSELYFALGALLAGFLARHFLQSRHEVSRILILFAMALVVFAVFIFNRSLGIFYAANILFGFSNASIRFNRVSYFWKLVPNHLMGRVSSVLNISSYLLRALWGFVFSLPIFTGREGIVAVMWILFFFILLSGIVIFKYSEDIKSLEN